MPIAIAIEGPGADRALADFLAIEGISESVQPAEPGETEREGVLVAIGAIIGVASGIAQVVSSILDWRDRLKKKANDSKQLSVVIEDARGNRLMLDNATPEQITAALQTLAR